MKQNTSANRNKSSRYYQNLRKEMLAALQSLKTLMVNLDKEILRTGDLSESSYQQLDVLVTAAIKKFHEVAGPSSTLTPEEKVALGQRFQEDILPYILMTDTTERMYSKPYMVYSMGLTDYLQDKIVLRLLNAIYSILAPGGKVILGNYYAQNFYKEYLDHVLAIPNDHPLRQKPYVEAIDFVKEVLLTYSSNYEENYSFQKVLQPAGIVPRKVISVQLTEAIIEMVAAGLGVAVLAKWLIAPYLEAGKVSCVRITRHGLHRTWYAAIINTTYQPNYLHNFICYLKQLKLAP